MAAPEMLAMLKECLSRMEDVTDDMEGYDAFDLVCGNCDAAVPLPHSFGCRLRSLISKVEGKREEDARLIAAAPELLEACKRWESLLYTVRNLYGNNPTVQWLMRSEVFAQTHAAIAKADGE